MWEYITIGIRIFIFFVGIRIVRPIEVGLTERLGKYTKTSQQGFRWIIPIIDRMIKVNMTERMVDIQPQMVITKDKLNAEVDAIVYYKIKDAKASQYNVNDHKIQLTSLARTTLRAVIGKMTLTDANEKRDSINEQVYTVLQKETNSYGVDILRVEIQRIEPPQDVQVAMNKVVKAEQEKISAVDIATSVETKADGERRAKIKEAEGIKQGLILESDGRAEAIKRVAKANAERIKVVNESAAKYFKGDAQTLKELEVRQASLENNSKVILTEKGITPTLLIGDLPLKEKGK